MPLDVLKRWRKGKFSLTMYDTHKRDWRGQTKIGYRFRYDGKEIFRGEDFSGSPMHADDSRETVGALLTFLSLKPGDTDSEYFADYTPEQMEFCQSHGEELSIYAMELEGTL